MTEVEYKEILKACQRGDATNEQIQLARRHTQLKLEDASDQLEYAARQDFTTVEGFTHLSEVERILKLVTWEAACLKMGAQTQKV